MARKQTTRVRTVLILFGIQCPHRLCLVRILASKQIISLFVMNTIQSTSFPCRRSRDAFNIEVFVHSHEEMKARLSRVRYLYLI